MMDYIIKLCCILDYEIDTDMLLSENNNVWLTNVINNTGLNENNIMIQLEFISITKHKEINICWNSKVLICVFEELNKIFHKLFPLCQIKNYYYKCNNLMIHNIIHI